MKIKWQFNRRDIKWQGNGFYVFLPQNQVWFHPASLAELETFVATKHSYEYISQEDLTLAEDK